MNEPRIINIDERKLIGMRIETSLSENETLELWRRFKPRVKEIDARSNTDFYSVQIFGKGLKLNEFTPATKFEKWAAVEVENFKNVPDEMETLTLAGGKYAVFIHQGLPHEFPRTSAFIHGEWLPNSEFEPDDRPHFEIMDAQYSATNPQAHEEIWIPIRAKQKNQEF